MGYEAQMVDSVGFIRIPTQNIPGFEQACITKYEEEGSLSWVHEDVRKGASVILTNYGFTITENPLGGIEVTDFAFSKIGSDFDFMVDAISKAMEEGTEAAWEMIGEDDVSWRIHFTGGEAAESTVGIKVITFEDRLSGRPDLLKAREVASA
jgi:hypothetical protein